MDKERNSTIRKIQNISKIFVFVISLLSLASCSKGDEDNSSTSTTNAMSVNIQPDTWTYISLSDGKIVGTSELGDTDAEKAWHDRIDWDVALCNGIIRTNSGTSGIGRGGIMSSPQSFDNVDASAVTSFNVDADTVTVRRIGN